MHFCLTFGAILIVFITNIYCDDSGKRDESGRILVPTAPVNVSIRNVTSTEILLSWATPLSTKKTHHNPKSQHIVKLEPPTHKSLEDSVMYHNEKDGTLIGLLSDVRPSEYNARLVKEYYERDQVLAEGTSLDNGRTSLRQSRNIPRRHRKRRQENTTVKKLTGSDVSTTLAFTSTELLVEPLETTPKPVTVLSVEETQPSINYVLYYEEGGMRMDRMRDRPITVDFDVRTNSIFFSDRGPGVDNYTGFARNVTLREEPGRKGRKGSRYTLKRLKPFTPYKIWLRAYFAPNLSTLGDRAYANIPSLESTTFDSFNDEDLHLDMNVLPRLGPASDPLYVITDVVAPSAPQILNLTCQQPPGTLFIQWRRPDAFVNSIDYYFVTLRRVPAPETEEDKLSRNYTHSGLIDFVKKISFDASKDHTETSFSLVLDSYNGSIYEVTVVAATKSIVGESLLLNGSETDAQKVRMSSDCVPVPLAMSPPLRDETGKLVPNAEVLDSAIISMLCIIVLILVAIGLFAMLVYWRSRLSKCLSAAYSYLEEGGTGDRVVTGGAQVRKYCKAMSSSPRRSNQKVMSAELPLPIPEGDVTTLRLADPRRPPVPRAQFSAHVTSLHSDGDIGFSKEYELVQARSVSLGYTSHYSHRPENRHKNRYLNITAYDHSRVCLLPSSSPCCSDNKESKKHKEDNCSAGNCDYINANFIDGIVARVDDSLKNIILKKHDNMEERRRRKELELEASRKAAPAENTDVTQVSSSDEEKPEFDAEKCNPEEPGSEIESAFLNIEFSGIVESDEDEEANRREGMKLKLEKAVNIDIADDGDDDEEEVEIELDDLHLDLDGRKVQIRSEWLVWHRRYIATQGPTPATLDSFWRMVWDHSTTTIVMITNLIERGRRKCDMYWPKEGTSCYGVIEVTMIHEDIMATYTVRTFLIRHIKHCCKKGTSSKSSQDTSPVSEGATEQAYRIVRQFHYTVWPDHGTPDHPLSVLHFVREAGRSAQNNHQGGGVLVHCSAGVGRTGTYIVLDAMLNHLQLTDTINIFGFLCHVRTQRNFLVQTEEQYIFIHAALLEAIQSGETNIPITDMRSYLKELFASLPEKKVVVNDLKQIEGDYVNLNGREIEELEELTEGSNSNSKPRVPDSMVAEANSSSDSLKINGNAYESEKQLEVTELNLKGYNSRSESNLAAPEKPEFRPLSNCLDTRKVMFLNGIRNDSKSDTNDDSKDISNEECISDDKCIYAVNEISKDALKRKNRDENYELLERMWSISSSSQRQKDLDDDYHPTNLLENQFMLMRHCNPVCTAARAPHNEHKNRPKGMLPSDASRVLLVPKPGQEGSDYINATWMQGRRRVREYVTAQHPPILQTKTSPSGDHSTVTTVGPTADFWRMLWDHTCQIVVILSDMDSDEHCQNFWPTIEQPQQIYGNYRVCYLSQKKFSPRLKRYQQCPKCHRPHVEKHTNNIEATAATPTNRESVKITLYNKTDNEPEISDTEMNGYAEDHVKSFYHRQGSIENQDEERLISPRVDESGRIVELVSGEPSGTNEAERNLLDRTELRIDNLNKSRPDFGDGDAKKAKLNARNSIANGDLFASLTECSKKSGAGPKSPSKMSLKNFKIGSPVLKSPTKFKFPDFGAKISFSAEKHDTEKKMVSCETESKCAEFESCFEFLPTANINEDTSVITETTVSMHSLQDDYELTVKIVECPDWMTDEEIQTRLSYEKAKEDSENDRSVLSRLMSAYKSENKDGSDEAGTVDEFLRPLKMVFTLPEFMGKCQMEFKNSPVVVVDKFGGPRCSTLCVLNTAAACVSASARDPVASKVPCPDTFAGCMPSFDVYACAALHACRRGIDTSNILVANPGVWNKPDHLLGIYASVAAYGELLKEIGFKTPLCNCDGNT